jgi:hypothetical protein
VISHSQRPLHIQYSVSGIRTRDLDNQAAADLGARNDTTQHSGQNPDKAEKISHFIACGNGYTDADPTSVLFPNNSRISNPTAYDFSIRAVDKTYLTEFVRECRLFWDQRDRKYNRDLKPKGWDEILVLKKLNYTNWY